MKITRQLLAKTTTKKTKKSLPKILVSLPATKKPLRPVDLDKATLDYVHGLLLQEERSNDNVARDAARKGNFTYAAYANERKEAFDDAAYLVRCLMD